MNLYNLILGLSAIMLCTIAIVVSKYGLASAGPLMIFFLLILAIGCRGYERLKGFSYSLVIFSAVTLALYYPDYFIQYDGFAFSGLITPLIQLIMFGMGTSMSVKDFVEVIRSPKKVVLGSMVQFTVMPIIGFTLAQLSGFPPEIAAGMILIGCSPSGMASNVMAYLAKANLALSITLTSVSTLCAPLITPLLMKLLAGTFIEIDVMKMMWDIVKMVILPIGGGLLFNWIFMGKLKWMNTVMPFVSMTGIACIIVIITAAGRDSLLHIGGLLVLFVLIHNVSGYLLGYWMGRAFKFDERDCRTLAIETGMQNGGLASGIAKEIGRLATTGLAPAVFGPLMNITGSILASYWQKKTIKEGVEQKNEVERT
ncbi:bile acid:sodium symporter family protein [Parapedobacter sp. SGR-10]|nr:bile acid:sodium symporter family protein [Parapedobacter sp. SGR-10]